ncbi:MAG: DUF3159 domain-containing protein [Actinobacteria bacterium]|uniref:Unannotated protein n=1 Tax=freshwater metagenome TaxID=449393 RepID=A0A6J7HFW4_9ZZZZ|nr:DUF3159 domain-containing protein [Actinomycetota bacterium]
MAPAESSNPAEEGIPQEPAEPEVFEHETKADIRAESILLERAIGGWRGMIDSGVPTAVFVIAFIVTSQNLRASVISALVAGGIIVVWRLIRREKLGQIAAGFIGLAISAWWASRNDNASDIYLPGMLTNLGYGSAFLISIIVRWPLLGIAMGFLTGERTRWRQDPNLRRIYAAASWIWVALFFSRLIIQTPMYLAGWVELQGIVKIVMGYPLFLGAAYWTYRVLAPVLREQRAARDEAALPKTDRPEG